MPVLFHPFLHSPVATYSNTLQLVTLASHSHTCDCSSRVKMTPTAFCRPTHYCCCCVQLRCVLMCLFHRRRCHFRVTRLTQIVRYRMCIYSSVDSVPDNVIHL